MSRPIHNCYSSHVASVTIICINELLQSYSIRELHVTQKWRSRFASFIWCNDTIEQKCSICKIVRMSKLHFYLRTQAQPWIKFGSSWKIESVSRIEVTLKKRLNGYFQTGCRRGMSRNEVIIWSKSVEYCSTLFDLMLMHNLVNSLEKPLVRPHVHDQ